VAANGGQQAEKREKGDPRRGYSLQILRSKFDIMRQRIILDEEKEREAQKHRKSMSPSKAQSPAQNTLRSQNDLDRQTKRTQKSKLSKRNKV
jgi:hypothetical protein